MRLGFGDVQLRETLKDADFARERRRIGVARVRVCGLFCLRKREWQCGQNMEAGEQFGKKARSGGNCEGVTKQGL